MYLMHAITIVFLLAVSPHDCIGRRIRENRQDESSRQRPPVFNPACAVHPACAALGLTGTCCPTIDNTVLDCCNDTALPTEPPTAPPTAPPTSPPTPPPTAPPTSPPTPPPTRHPTPPPTRHPTPPPTRHPTLPPTRHPTAPPTRHPTAPPTRNPTAPPTTHFNDASCSANPGCAALGLRGQCCPGNNGRTRACCFFHPTQPTRHPTPPPTRHPTPPPTTHPTPPPTTHPTPPPTTHFTDASCSANPGCAALGLTGQCCPNNNGRTRACCFFEPTPVCPNDILECPTGETYSRDPANGCQFPSCPPVPPNPNRDRSCSLNPACAALGLEGACCPTVDGMPLACCDESPAIFCPQDVLECPTGETYNRDPANNCQFPACPPYPCSQDIIECSAGETYNRDPMNDCHFPPCPPVNDPSCASNPGCAELGLTGNCCPTHNGRTRACCFFEPTPFCPNDILECPTGETYSRDPNNGCRFPSCPPVPPHNNPGASCSSNPGCAARGLAGECCPTIDKKMLACCEVSPPVCPLDVLDCPTGERYNRDPMNNCQFPLCPSDRTLPNPNGSCSSNPGCAALDLEGECCPTIDGSVLDCCKGPYTFGSCAANSGCADIGLEGNCCPTNTGVYLDCCNQSPLFGSCDSNPACADLGMRGECCPTSTGVTLSCCDEIPPPSGSSGSCESHPVCRNLGLTGECCPTTLGLTLECCF